MLIYSIFMLVESTIMLNTMLTVVAIITKKAAISVVYQWPTVDFGSDSDIEPSSDIECYCEKFWAEIYLRCAETCLKVACLGKEE